MNFWARTIPVFLIGACHSVAAYASEPTERELFQALKNYYDSVSEAQKGRMAKCKAGRGQPLECASVMLGSLSIEVLSVRKRGCEKRQAKNEYDCTFTMNVNVDSSNEMLERQMSEYLNSELNYRFLRSGKDVRLLPAE